MIETVTYKENGDIEIDNTELLGTRSDMSDESETLQNPNPGCATTKLEKTLKADEKRLNWHEPRKPKQTDVLHICPICGTQYYGRPNKKYCDTPCKEIAKKRRQRAAKK